MLRLSCLGDGRSADDEVHSSSRDGERDKLASPLFVAVPDRKLLLVGAGNAPGMPRQTSLSSPIAGVGEMQDELVGVAPPTALLKVFHDRAIAGAVDHPAFVVIGQHGAKPQDGENVVAIAMEVF